MIHAAVELVKVNILVLFSILFGRDNFFKPALALSRTTLLLVVYIHYIYSSLINSLRHAFRIVEIVEDDHYPSSDC